MLEKKGKEVPMCVDKFVRVGGLGGKRRGSLIRKPCLG